ncbi:uncharacterized protein RJT20DRAFT_127799 [Scheffersomyces xylosifermentans]|uniref:uncharacterized protein n=1 Tax=Scheffersomyces xylosifermentans TaxID=1304137 RepID=UPI00315C97A3
MSSDKQETKSVHGLIAYFLKNNHYHATLKKFEEEHGKPIDPKKLPSSDETLEEIVNDRINYNELRKQFEQIDVHEELSVELKELIGSQIGHWTAPYPHIGVDLVSPKISSLVLSSCHDAKTNVLFLTTNDFRLIGIDLESQKVIFSLINVLNRIVIKKILVDGDHLVLVGMDGKFYNYTYTFGNGEIQLTRVAEFQAHKRLVVDAKYIVFEGQQYIVSLGWDFFLKVFRIVGDEFEFLSEYKLATQGTSFDVVNYNDQLVVVLAKNENTLLDVLTVDNGKQLTLRYKISLNDAEFSSSSFSPRYIAIQQLGDSVPLIAVGTSHEPYMRLIVVSLKELPSLKKTEDESIQIKRNQILKNFNTLSPQDRYSQALISWRVADEKSIGVWVAGEDGVVRGIDLLDEKIVVELKAHSGKIKDFLSFENKDKKEVIITSGIDKDIKQFIV